MKAADYDLIVVGCGAAGVATARSFLLTMASNGKSGRVAIIEASTREDRGGATRWTTARFRVNADKSLDRMVIGKVEEASKGLADLDYFRTLDAEAPRTMEFLEEEGVELIAYGSPIATEVQHEMRPNGGGHAIVETLGAKLDVDENVDFYYQHEAVRLMAADDGEIQGVVVRGPDGRLAEIRGRSTVLACGGFEGNPEMLTRYVGDNAVDLKLLAPGLASNRGNGIRMAAEVGAGLSGQYDMIHSELVDLRTDRADAVIYGHTFGIVVNGEGKRFYDEGQACFDQTFELIAFEVWKNQAQTAFFIADQTITSNPIVMSVFDTDMPPIEADTLEELASLLGLDEDALIETVNNFNAAVQPGEFDPHKIDGKRTEGVEPPKSNWAYPLVNSPYFAYPLKAAICFTYGGIRTDHRARVVSNYGVPIPNLFAAGEIVGAFYHEYTAGTSVLRSLTFGRVAGREAAALVAAG